MSDYHDIYEVILANKDDEGVTGIAGKWQLDTLKAKLNSQAVKQNPRGFDYLEGWYVIETLNRIFGYNAWSGRIKELSVGPPVAAKVGRDQKDGFKQGAYCIYELEVEFADGSKVTKTGVGYGSATMQDKVLVEESAVKEAETDAMKRAARYLGNKFGNCLYDSQKRGVEK